ncbi:MAG: L,D-transpeptidase family protein [Streptosporangiales bacterium]|nr:L,D-transpeptidase family protein [Streptosporangiales bacterium]
MDMRDDAANARYFVAAVMVLSALLTLTYIDVGWSSGPATREVAATHTPTPTAPKARVNIEPADQTRKVRPDGRVVIRATGGRLTAVSVESKNGRELEGSYNADRTTWTSRWSMKPSMKYVANAVAANRDHEATSASSTFRTLTPPSTFTAFSYSSGIAPSGSTVGVGFPLILNFTAPITNKTAVERALDVDMSKPVEGAWHWTSDTEVVYRPKHYWPAHQKIRLKAHLAGVKAGKGLYGAKNYSARYKVGERVIVKGSAKTHHMTVYENGKKVNRWPVSMGQGGVWKYYTTSGVHLTMGKSNPERMISPGIEKGEPGYYDEVVYFAVRISNSGEYIHSMPSTVWAQGRQNVSHGCINSPPAKAEWFYNYTHPGDVVILKGTPRKLEWNNGWGYWQKSWKSWVAGSALNKPATP